MTDAQLLTLNAFLFFANIALAINLVRLIKEKRHDD